LLSDRKDFASVVTEGTLKGLSITKLMEDYHYEIMGSSGYHYQRFPLLLKFLDCKEVLSVQVHPSDAHKEFIPGGDSGKTEAWIVVETTENSLIYAGLQKGTNKENLMKSLQEKSVSERLYRFTPHVG